MSPYSGATMLLDFLNPVLDPRITFSRGTGATRVNASGFIETVGNTTPRFDYDPVTLAPRGLLIEEARTNLLTYSEQFTDASWVVNGSPVITANQTIAPDGTITADTIAVSGASNSFGVYRNVVSSGTYASSLYFKLMSGAFTLRIGLTNNFSEINCSTLAITNTGTGVGSVSAVGNGWYRFVSVGTIAALSASVIYNIGSNTGTLAVWGAQLEAGSFATSYIPTVASTVTRNADVATMTGTNFSSWYNQSEGTFVADFDKYSATTRGFPFCAGNTSAVSPTEICVDGNTDGKIRAYIENAGSVEMANTTLANYTPNIPIKAAIAYATNNAVGAAAGALGTVDTSVVVPTVDILQIGALRNRTVAASDFLNGHIRTIAYFNTRLPNAQLQTLTAPSLATTLSLDFTSGSYNVGF